MKNSKYNEKVDYYKSFCIRKVMKLPIIKEADK